MVVEEYKATEGVTVNIGVKVMKMNAVIKYPGSKWRIADWIIGYFPEHHSYLEPFLGSGATLFRKKPSNIETVNDLDDAVINLFDCIRRDPERLSREIYLTPYSRQVYENTYSPVLSSDPFERARNFIIRCNMGHGFRTTGKKVGWKNDVQGREKSYAVKYWNHLPDQLIAIAERLKVVQIEKRPAVELIVKFNYPNVFIYADPPYLLKTRHGKQYRHEMDEGDHMELLHTLMKHKGHVILSGYDSELYNDMLTGWHRETRISYTQTMKPKTEVLWMNFEPERQMSLID